jgi:hypothetical protein
MEDGSTISFTMCAFTDKCYRYIHVMGTQGEITGDMDSNIVKSVRFGNPWKEYDLNNDSGISGHGGGDSGIIDEFLDQIINDRDDNDRTTTIERSMESHFMAFAAEKSRLNGGMPVSIDEYRK